METITSDLLDQRHAKAWPALVANYVAHVTPDAQPHENLTFSTLGQRHFHGRLEHGKLGSLHLCRLQATSHAISRAVNPGWSEGRDTWLLILQISGISIYDHDQRHRVMTPDKMHLVNCAEPFAVRSPQGCEQLIVFLPQTAQFPSSQRDVFWQYNGLGPLSLLGATVRNVFQFHDQIHNDVAVNLERTILSLVSNACRDMSAPMTQPAAIGNELFRRLSAYIDDHLVDDALSPQSAADFLHCSVRTIHRIFQTEETGLSFSRYVWQRRLEKSMEDLASPDQSSCSITDIAYRWGFSSSAHYSRRFKAIIGQSPSAYRACQPTAEPGFPEKPNGDLAFSDAAHPEECSTE
ncbi:helix-turn-helix domain-containing protein [Rhizobium pusense]|uniref:helix-turn-helix domain-containing protein n=1 Tax=Agrobacterium pusense TaxID=648995 RepID=UPI001FCD8851|nr:helix-turn-helix domain-containing protein [Agrobacterium pusense]MCJ2877386.1 helix-turn-helix domain-containing protein [Agrobacterium pusense]